MRKCIPCGVGGLHLVWVAPVRPEEEHPVELGLDVRDLLQLRRIDAQEASVSLQNTFTPLIDSEFFPVKGAHFAVVL